ncbi:hypothetical protein [Fodinibius salicampi]|nr:hypothetical protein [Fodinibius salicampi]
MSNGKVLHFSGQRMQNKDSLKTVVEVFNPRGDLSERAPLMR